MKRSLIQAWLAPMAAVRLIEAIPGRRTRLDENNSI
jgi:hypothetical protein